MRHGPRLVVLTVLSVVVFPGLACHAPDRGRDEAGENASVRQEGQRSPDRGPDTQVVKTEMPPDATPPRDADSDSDKPTVNENVRQDGGRFQEAYALITEGKYGSALRLLQQNIAETPDAGDIDYAYGWAVVCAAHLGDAGRTLEYYEVVRTRFGGWQHFGAGGAHRRWEDNLQMARRAVMAAELPNREQILRRMDELDRLGRQTEVRKLKVLIRRAQEGDQMAIERLRSDGPLELLVDLIADKQLRLSGN